MEERISMHSHKPHATSQPSRFSHTYRPSTATMSSRGEHKPAETFVPTAPRSKARSTHLHRWHDCAIAWMRLIGCDHMVLA